MRKVNDVAAAINAFNEGLRKGYVRGELWRIVLPVKLEAFRFEPYGRTVVDDKPAQEIFTFVKNGGSWYLSE